MSTPVRDLVADKDGRVLAWESNAASVGRCDMRPWLLCTDCGIPTGRWTVGEGRDPAPESCPFRNWVAFCGQTFRLAAEMAADKRDPRLSEPPLGYGPAVPPTSTSVSVAEFVEDCLTAKRRLAATGTAYIQSGRTPSWRTFNGRVNVGLGASTRRRRRRSGWPASPGKTLELTL